MSEIAIRLAKEAKFGFQAVKSVVIPASAAVFPAIAAAGGLAKKAFNIVKFEIFRDFFQILSLFFSGLKDQLPAGFQQVWGRVTQLFSFCVSCVISDWYYRNLDTINRVIFYVEVALALLGSIIFYYRYRKYDPNDAQQGLEVRKWGHRSINERRFAQYSALLLTTLYLPVARDTVQILSCDLKFCPVGDTCYKSQHAVLSVLAGFALLIYLLPLPFVFYKIIKRHKPKQTLYDAEGKLRQGAKAYTLADYRQDLQKDQCPYKSLYDSYEREWAFYKVVVMMMKVLLVLPVVIFVSSNSVGGRDEEFENTRRNNLLLVQSIVTVLVLAAYFTASYLSSPFIDPTNDYLERFSIGCTLATAIVGLITWWVQSNTVFSIILNVLAGFSFFVMMLTMLSSLPAVRTMVKNATQKLDLTMARIDPRVPLIFSNELDLARERKLRIWHEFWDVLFAQDPLLRLPNKYAGSLPKRQKESEGAWAGNGQEGYGAIAAMEQGGVHLESKESGEEKYAPVALEYHQGGGPPFLMQFQGTVAERHEENKRIASSESAASYEAQLFYAAQFAQSLSVANHPYLPLRNNVMTAIYQLHGLDVFWDGEVEGKPLGEKSSERQRITKPGSSSTHFGKMYIIPFPFTAMLYMDDVEEQVIFSMSPVVAGVKRDAQAGMNQFFQFVQRNLSPDVQQRRQLRLQLRAMNGHMVRFFYQRWITKTKYRTVTKRDANGNTRTETESYTVRVHFTFNNGRFGVAQSSQPTMWRDPATGRDVDMGRGFTASIHYADGTGVDNEGKHWDNEHLTIYGSDFGLDNTFRVNSASLQKLLRDNWHVVTQNINDVVQRYQRYREDYAAQFVKKENVLSYGFWFYIYNNDLMERGNLEYALAACEPNPLVKQLPAKYQTEFTMLYNKLAYYNCHPSVSFWFIFWHDLWIHNQSMRAFGGDQANNSDGSNDHEGRKLLDPYSPTAICYRPMVRVELEELLEKYGLRLNGGKKRFFGMRQGLINNELLDQLYDKMHMLTMNYEERKQQELMMAQAFQANYQSQVAMFALTPQVQAEVAQQQQPVMMLMSESKDNEAAYDQYANYWAQQEQQQQQQQHQGQLMMPSAPVLPQHYAQGCPEPSQPLRSYSSRNLNLEIHEAEDDLGPPPSYGA